VTHTLRRFGPGPLVLLCLLVTAVSAGDDRIATDAAKQDWEKVTETWFDDLQPGKTVHLTNPHGNVYCRFGGYEPRVEIIGTFQRLDDQALPALTVRRTIAANGDLEVEAVFGDGAASGDGSPRVRRDRVDIVVFLPKGIHLEVQTEDGMVEAKKLQSDFGFRSSTGTLMARGIKGTVHASSDRGRLQVFLDNGHTDQLQEFVTVTGEIELTLWEDATQDVTLATSGEISTDFSLQFEYKNFEEPGKIATATTNGGGPAVRLHSQRGPIRLLRQQRDFTPAENR